MRSVDDNLLGLAPARAAKSAAKSAQKSPDMDAAKQGGGFSSAFADAGKKHQPMISIAAKPETDTVARSGGGVASGFRTNFTMPEKVPAGTATDDTPIVTGGKEVPADGRAKDVPAVVRETEVPPEGIAKRLLVERDAEAVARPSRADETSVGGRAAKLPAQMPATDVPAEGIAKRSLVQNDAKAVPGQPPAEKIPAIGLAGETLAEMREPDVLAKEPAKKSSVEVSAKDRPAEIRAKDLPTQETSKDVPARTVAKDMAAVGLAKSASAERPAKQLPAEGFVKMLPGLGLGKSLAVDGAARPSPAEGAAKSLPTANAAKILPAGEPARELPAVARTNDVPTEMRIKELPASSAAKDVPVQGSVKEMPAKAVRPEGSVKDAPVEVRTRDVSTTVSVKDAQTKFAALADQPAKAVPVKDVVADVRVSAPPVEKSKADAVPAKADAVPVKAEAVPVNDAREKGDTRVLAVKTAQPIVSKQEPETAVPSKESATPLVLKTVAAPEGEKAVASTKSPPVEAGKVKPAPLDPVLDIKSQIVSDVETTPSVVLHPAPTVISAANPPLLDTDEQQVPQAGSMGQVEPSLPVLPKANSDTIPQGEEPAEADAIGKAAALLENPKIQPLQAVTEPLGKAGEPVEPISSVEPIDTVSADVYQLLTMLGVAPAQTTAVSSEAPRQTPAFSEFQALADRAGEIKSAAVETGTQTETAKSETKKPDDSNTTKISRDAGSSDQMFRFARADGKGQSVSMSIASDTDKAVAKSEAQAATATPSRSETVTVLEARRYLGLAPTSNASNVINQIVSNSNWAPALQPGAEPLTPVTAGQTGKVLNTLKIQMNPIDLGMVTATLRLKDDELHVQLKVETGDAFRQLSDDQSEMVKALRAQGFAVDQVSIVFNAPDSSSSSNSQQPAQSQTGQPGREAPGDGTTQGRGQRNDSSSQEQSRGRWTGNDGKGDASSAADSGRAGDVYM